MSYDGKINAEIRGCLDEFSPGESPIAHLARHLDRLHADSSWTQPEIHEFEATVRHVLACLVGGEVQDAAEPMTR